MKKIIAIGLVLAGFWQLSAGELKGFFGIQFGMNVSEGDFTGPDEDGDYSFVPKKGPTDSSMHFFASVTKKSKRVYAVTLVQETVSQQSLEILRGYTKDVENTYGKNCRRVKNRTTEWNNYVNGVLSTTKGVVRDTYRIWVFEDESGNLRQLIHMFLVNNDGALAMNLTGVDQRLSELDDEETAGGAANVVGMDEKSAGVQSVATANQEKVQTGQSQSSPKEISEDEAAERLKSFLGYTFGQQYGAMEDGPAGMTMHIRLGRAFRYIKEGYGFGNAQGRLKKLILTGKFPDGMSIEDARAEVGAMAEMFERKYGIKMEESWNGRRYRSKDGQVILLARIDETDQEFRLEVENVRALSLGRKVEKLGADVGADML